MARQDDRGRGRRRRGAAAQVPRERRRCSRRGDQARACARARSATRSASACAARRSRTRACRRCSMRSSSSCPRRWKCRRSRACSRTARKATRAPSDDEPFSALAFKILNDPFVGNLTFFRVYSGVLNSGDTVYESRQGAQGAHRPPAADARQRAQRDQGSARRRHRRGRGPEGRDHRRHAVRPGARHHAREDGVPGAGDLRRGGAEDQGRPGKDGPRAAAPREGRPVVPHVAPIRSPARRSSPAWASCTSRSSSTA